MKITNTNSNPNFGASLTHSKDMLRIVQYAKNNSQDLKKLLDAERNINKQDCYTRLNLELFETKDGFPFILFTRFIPKKGVKLSQGNEKDFINYEPIFVQSKKHIDPFKFGLDMILRLGYNSPNNKIYQRIVLGKNVDVTNHIYEVI